jgi:hypothetical protein
MRSILDIDTMCLFDARKAELAFRIFCCKVIDASTRIPDASSLHAMCDPATGLERSCDVRSRLEHKDVDQDSEI